MKGVLYRDFYTQVIQGEGKGTINASIYKVLKDLDPTLFQAKMP